MDPILCEDEDFLLGEVIHERPVWPSSEWAKHILTLINHNGNKPCRGKKRANDHAIRQWA